MKMQKKMWFTSDLHFFHKNVVEYCNRPTTVEEMTEWLITTLNTYIGENDDVYHLGDFAFKDDYTDVLSRLNGKWHFVKGNHDVEKKMLKAIDATGNKHVYLGSYHEMKYDGRKIVLCHYPFKTWNCSHYGSINIHGHQHGEGLNRHFKYKWMKKVAVWLKLDKRKPTPNQIDVGIDAIDGFKPIEINDLMALLAKQNPKNRKVNHHGRYELSKFDQLINFIKKLLDRKG